MTKEMQIKLIEKAKEARGMAYTPYSNFDVGAALLTKGGNIYKGCNIESAAYTPTNCAERTAFFKAVSEGEKEFEAIAVVGGPKGKAADELCPPCGVCRQVMMDFCDPNQFKIILVDKEQIKEYKLCELLPLGFGPSNLE